MATTDNAEQIASKIEFTLRDLESVQDKLRRLIVRMPTSAQQQIVEEVNSSISMARGKLEAVRNTL